jgi:serine protease AprX
MLTRRPWVAFVLVALVAVPAAGCMDLANASKNGYGENWPLKMVQANVLHDKGLTGKGVKVAIIDTGIDLSHPEFRGVQVAWADLVNHRADAYDDHGHGTHIAGIVAAQGTWSTILSNFRLKGIAPAVSLIVVKVMDAQGNGDEPRVAQGINTAVGAGADVIVLSLGGQTRAIFGTNTENAVKAAIGRGVFVVAAAGNLDKESGETDCAITSPASVEGVIAVGAVSRTGAIADFSCHGTGKEGQGQIAPGIPSPVGGSVDPHKKPELVAPGVDVLSSWSKSAVSHASEYALASGTSQAAPIVGGVLALILQAHPELAQQDEATVYRVKEALMSSSRKIGPLDPGDATSHDERYGYGLVQADALLRAVA